MFRITDNTDELSFHQLTSRSATLSIPIFQRPYVWTKRQFDRMCREIESIVDNRDQSRFLGAVVAVTRPTNPSQPTPYEIVDGQQRLTTLYLILLGIAQIAAREGRGEFARGLIGTNLIVDWAQQGHSNTKLLPSMGDRNQFKAVFESVWKTGDLDDWLPTKARLAVGVGPNAGPLTRQFTNIQKWLRQKNVNGGFNLIDKILDAARNKLTFVFILIRDPGSATTVFEGLNDPGVPISIGDLVKNEVFARKEYSAEDAQQLHDTQWVPFLEKFGDKFNDYFFPYSVIIKPNTSQTEMFGTLREVWKDLDASSIIEELDEYSKSFLSLAGIISSREHFGKNVAACLDRLVTLKQPSSTYSFLMKLLKTYEDGLISSKETSDILNTIESFLVRRAICGIEPTGLLGLFRTMWSATDGHPTSENVAAVILKRLTVEWPNDQRFAEAIRSRPLYGSAVARHVILEYDKSLGTDYPTSEIGTIEHVMPTSWSENLADVISRAEHAKFKDLWANLIPLTEKMNQAVAQSAFSIKRKIFERESIYISARNLGAKYETWGVQEIQERSEELSTWAIERWKRPNST